MEKYSRPGQATDGNIIRLMRFACWFTQATSPLTICNTYCFLLQLLLHERASMLRYSVRILCVLCLCKPVPHICVDSVNSCVRLDRLVFVDLTAIYLVLLFSAVGCRTRTDLSYCKFDVSVIFSLGTESASS